MNAEQAEAADFFDDLCRDIGIAVLRFAPLLDRLGWANTAAARTYLHASSLATAVFVDFIDLVRNTNKAATAAERLNAIAETWGLDQFEMPERSTA